MLEQTVPLELDPRSLAEEALHVDLESVTDIVGLFHFAHVYVKSVAHCPVAVSLPARENVGFGTEHVPSDAFDTHPVDADG